MLKIDFEHLMHARVKTVDGNEGIITHCGIDGGGQIYLVQWKKEDGDVNSRWYRQIEILQ